jgi:hypothetical protein
MFFARYVMITPELSKLPIFLPQNCKIIPLTTDARNKESEAFHYKLIV